MKLDITPKIMDLIMALQDDEAELYLMPAHAVTVKIEVIEPEAPKPWNDCSSLDLGTLLECNNCGSFFDAPCQFDCPGTDA